MPRLRAALGGLLVAGASACTGLPKPPAPVNPVRVLLLNDVYVADTLADGTGGLARAATVRARLAAEGRTLFVLAGDVLGPSLLSKYYGGAQMVEALNAAGLDYATLGNHDAELPRDTLLARIAQSRFKWLSANCRSADGGRLPGVLPWDTVRVFGRKVGIFGTTLAGDWRAGTTCSDPDSAADVAMDSLRQLGADLILALTHQTVEADAALLGRQADLVAVLGGHEHEAHTVSVGTRYVLKADANARSAQSLAIWGTKGDWRQSPRLLPLGPGIPLDTAVARVVRAWDDSLRRRLGPDRVVGTLTAPIDARDAIQRRQETALGDLVADAFRAGTGADAALFNAGTLRLDDVLRAGPLSRWTLESLFLFPDETRSIVVPLTGARVRELLEHGLSDRNLGRGGFPQVAGLAVVAERNRPSGSRVVSLAGPDGKPLAAGATLRLALPVFLACRGGDGYSVPEARAQCEQAGSAPRAADLLIAWVERQPGGRVDPPAAGRLTLR